MYPILFEIGNISIETYNILLCIGIISGFLTLYLSIKNLDSKKKKNIYLFAVLIFIPFVIGAKAGFLFENLFIPKNLKLEIIRSSFSLTWGFIFATILAFPLSKLFKLNIWEIGDYFALSISIGGFFIRLGCFFNGCCFGIPASSHFPFTIFFPVGSYAYKIFSDTNLYPTQLYLSLVWLLIFLFVLFYRKYQKFKGELIILMFILYSLFNFIIEFFRFHSERQFLVLSQIYNISIFFLSILLYVFKNKNLTK